METPAQIGPFPVRRVLGVGAAGSVFLCDHPRLGLSVAVKVLHERDPDHLARFQREAELMSRIKHPCVVEVFEAGACPLGPYLVLEYCPGEDLACALRARGALPPAEAARLLAQIARGVAAAHQAGVIHRDLKPQNVLVLEKGPKVTDFGIARAERRSALESLTQSGAILGTPSYMAPEQAESARDADERSDVYALGVILYECLAGRQPFPGATTLEVLNRVVEGRPDPLPAEIPESLAEVVRCAMSLDPGARFTSATFLAEALEELNLEPTPRALPFLSVAVAGFVIGSLVVGAALGSGALWPARATTPEPALAVSPEVTRASASTTPTPTTTPAPTASAVRGPKDGSAYRTKAYFLEKQRAWRLPRVAQLEPWVAKGSSAAALALGLRYQGGLGGVKRDRARAVELFEAMAAEGNADAMAALGLLLRRGGEERRAQELLREARSLGSHDAAWILARSSEDREALVATALRNAKLGDPSATLFLSEYAFGLADRGEAQAWCDVGMELRLPSAYAMNARLERLKLDGDPEKFAADYRRAAEGEDPEGLCGFARCLILGQGVPRDLDAAERCLEQAREARPVWALFERVHLFEVRGDRKAWLEGVHELLDLKEDQAPPHLWGGLGLHLVDKADNRAGALAAAAKFLSRSRPFLSFDPRVALRAGLAIQAKQVPVSGDPARAAAKLFARAAQLGHPQGAYVYGHALVYGRGVPVDVPEGLRLMKEGAEGGVVIAWGRLGDLYYRGLAGQLEVDSEAARELYRRGGEAGDAKSCFKYSAMLLRADDLEEGARWVKRAADLGSVPAQISYANCLLKGRGVPADSERALASLVRLAEREPMACEVLALAYRNGSGVEVDLEKSASYAARAKSLRRAQGGR